jgi:2-polyprenyl-6-methoxyphenol hydroxylase-like FAD-dependent oxidoreductase
MNSSIIATIHTVSINFIIIRTPEAELQKVLSFYTALGFSFETEQHDQGPVHYAAESNGVALEVYTTKKSHGSPSEAPSTLQLGVAVDSITDTSKVLKEHGFHGITQKNPDASFGTIKDPLGNTVIISGRASARSDEVSPHNFHIPRSTLPKECHTLIVGAGPTGLTAANKLVREEVPTRIIDARTVRTPLWRATGVQPRVLSKLDEFGTAQHIRREGIALMGTRIYLDGKHMQDVSFVDPATSHHPFSLCQGTLEDFLERSLDEGLTIERGMRIVDYHTSDRGGYVVHIQDEHRGAREEIHCQVLLGCDGGKSTVRDLAQLSFESTEFAGTSFMCEASITIGLDRSKAHFFLLENSRLILVPVPGEKNYKVSGTLPRNLWDDSQSLSMEHLIALLVAHKVGEFAIEKIHSFVRYKTRQGLADSFVKDTTLLCGDAAHLFPPRGGQGMNVGIEDGVLGAALVAQSFHCTDIGPLSRYASRRDEVRVRLDQVVRASRQYKYSAIAEGSLDPKIEHQRVVREEL